MARASESARTRQTSLARIGFEPVVRRDVRKEPSSPVPPVKICSQNTSLYCAYYCRGAFLLDCLRPHRSEGAVVIDELPHCDQRGMINFVLNALLQGKNVARKSEVSWV